MARHEFGHVAFLNLPLGALGGQLPLGGLHCRLLGNTEMPSRAYVGRFNFKGVDQGKRVGELSGGERGRLHLAKLRQNAFRQSVCGSTRTVA